MSDASFGPDQALVGQAPAPASRPARPPADGPGERAPGVSRNRGPATTRARATGATRARAIAPPILVRQIRNGIVESEHRGHIVEVDVAGRQIRQLGDPEHVVTLRSTVKPFGLIALIEAGGIETFALTPAEIAVMASSHSGEDLHVRTIQGVFRRARVTQSVLACGAEGMPLDPLTAARLARDGEKPGPIRHMCSGQHAAIILLARLRNLPIETYWQEDHPAMAEYRGAVARVFGTTVGRLQVAIDGCGIPTYAFPLREVARAFAILAAPELIADNDPRKSVVAAMTVIRDAMLANPELIAGTRDRLDTSLMKSLPGGVVSKGGMEALRGLAIVASDRSTGPAGPSGMAIKVEDGDGYERATWSATVEALRQAGVLDAAALRQLGRYHRPPSFDPHGRLAAEAVPDFDLAPVGELIG